MRRMTWGLLLGPILLMAAACTSAGGDAGAPTPTLTPTPGAGKIELRWDFNDGAGGWDGGFADYSPEHGDLQLDHGVAPLPESLDREGTGYRIIGMNRSDDLFMFIKRQVGAAEGIQPGQEYRLTYRVVFASDGPVGGMGVGGPPGEGVTLKAGASTEEPEAVLDASDNHWRMNIDHGQQVTGGTDAEVIGDITNGIDCEEALDAGSPHAEVERAAQLEHTATADAEGNLWLIVGTDSGFEGLTELFYMSIEVDLEPVA